MDSVCLWALGYRNVYLVVLCLVMRPRAVHIAKRVASYLQLKPAEIGLVITGSTVRGEGE